MNSKAFITVAFYLILFALISCKKSDPSPVGVDTDQITAGTWKISSFHENSSDHTDDFTGFTFAFGVNGTLTAIDSGITVTGSWEIDDDENELHLRIGNSEPLTEISKGWIILESSSTVLRLGDDSSNDEELDFIKL
jgi:hypothetical protein